MKPISLGSKPEGPCCATPEPSKSMYYPSVYMNLDDARLSNLPDGGTITFKFNKRSYTESTRDGKKSCSCELELQEVTDFDGVSKKKIPDAAEALETLRSALGEKDKD